MKILDLPQSGKRGLTVSLKSPFGLVSRIAGIPANPRTPSQMSVRAILSRVAASWRALQEVQRTAWMAAAKETKSNSRLGQSGALSGFQFSRQKTILARADSSALRATRVISQQQTKQQKKVSK